MLYCLYHLVWHSLYLLLKRSTEAAAGSSTLNADAVRSPMSLIRSKVFPIGSPRRNAQPSAAQQNAADAVEGQEPGRRASLDATRRSIVATKWRQAHAAVQKKVFRKEQAYLSREELILAVKRSRFRNAMER